MKGASLFEVFTSIQGEGLLVGVGQIFIRFAGCNLRCRYCDTKYALKVPKRCKFKISGGGWRKIYNPISVSRLIEAIKELGMDYHSISLTGGEPLLQADFILEFLETLPHPFLPIYLETNATLPKELKKIIDHLDIIAMDIKLPSFSNQGEFWMEHREFLSIAKEGKVFIFIKVVITRKTRLNEVERAISLVKELDGSIPFILQPDINSLPSRDWLLRCQRMAKASLKEVRIIPQVHKLMGWK